VKRDIIKEEEKRREIEFKRKREVVVETDKVC
jgi:hypothetical protein